MTFFYLVKDLSFEVICFDFDVGTKTKRCTILGSNVLTAQIGSAEPSNASRWSKTITKYERREIMGGASMRSVYIF